MFKKLLGKLAGKVVKNPLKRRLIVEMADDAVKHELDKRTGGLASKADDLAARVKAIRL